ncbi:MAG: hypothetical protein IKZ58_03790 [Selenomonadaceae bacterium]|nr:hypothetical protein [Selenomonadaceae bacterium]
MTTDEKLDYLIGKVESLENEIKKLKLDNEQSNYELNSKFYEAFKILHDDVYKLDAERYQHYSALNNTIHELNNRNYSLEKKISTVEKNIPMNQLIEKILMWSPAIMIAVIVWILIIIAILE